MNIIGWEACPVFFIPSAVLWVCLVAVCERFRFADWLATRFHLTERNAKKWLNRICVIVSFVLVTIILFVISILWHINLFSWGELD